MQAVVVYESMFGNTHTVADSIGDGLRNEGWKVSVVPVGDATAELIGSADLVVVGGPTHVHGMVRPTSQEGAEKQAEENPDLHLDPDAAGPLLRTWFDGLGKVDGTPSAAFDTRVDMSPVVTGRASKGIHKRLHRHGFTEAAPAESFLVDKENHLIAGEAERARRWGESLGETTERRGGPG